MRKELEYEFNNFANLLHKDCMNLMECLRKQSEDNKPILYLGKHYEKVILPYEEYQKMCNRLESIDNANPSEALECLERIDNTLCLNNIKGKLDFGIDTEEHTDCDSVIGMVEDLETIKEALLKAQEPKQYLKWEDLEFNHTPKMIDVKMNGNKYKLVVGYNVAGKNLAILRDGKKEYYFLECDKQFFNDLRLERVEE